MDELTVLATLDEHFDNYDYRPSERTKAAHLKWAMSLDTNTLKRSLDTDRHPRQANGQRNRPHLATLKDIAWDLLRQSADLRKQGERQWLDDEDCFDCGGTGWIYGVVKDRTFGYDYFYSAVVGRCECKYGDNLDPDIRRVKPPQYAVDRAKATDGSCIHVTEQIAREWNLRREKHLYNTAPI